MDKMSKISVTIIVVSLFIYLDMFIEIDNLRKDNTATEQALREKIVDSVHQHGEAVTAREELEKVKAELAVFQLKNIRKDILAKKTTDKESILAFDVDVLTPCEQVKKIDNLIREANQR